MRVVPMGRYYLLIILATIIPGMAHALECTPMPIIAGQNLNVLTVVENDEAAAAGISASALNDLIRASLHKLAVPLAMKDEMNTALLEVNVLPHAFPGPQGTLYAFTIIFRVHTPATLAGRVVHATVWENFATGVSDVRDSKKRSVRS